MFRIATLSLCLLAAACSSTRTSQSIDLPAARVEADLPQVQVRPIEAPHGSPLVGSYFEVENTSSERVTIAGYGTDNYFQQWQRQEYGVWVDQPAPTMASRLRQVPLEPGARSVFRGPSSGANDRVGLRVTIDGQTRLCWSSQR